MRLLHTSTLKMEEFFSGEVPEYAILSHRWEKEEVTYQDHISGTGRSLAGYSKIIGCCKQAALDGWTWAWVDSCCIDKSSSAELSEAINSMFNWYRGAEVCYVYLSDVQHLPGSGSKDGNTCWPDDSGFTRSKWFTRGWTLQELLAPETVVFYDHQWARIGTKTDLRALLSVITGIKDFVHFQSACVAQKMSWASKRKTTRVEDEAYCLMGLFGVNMAPLYGERDNAFYRLQLEIMSKTDDESIFAWEETRRDIMPHACKSGLLAASPRSFAKGGGLEFGVLHRPFGVERGVERAPYAMTNKGLRMDHFLIRNEDRELDERLALLNCRQASSGHHIAICLTEVGQSIRHRTFGTELFLVDPEKERFATRTLFTTQCYDYIDPGIYSTSKRQLIPPGRRRL